MANTTNFGWETPDDTDLVKDGALAMRTLGNAIDTSLVDLKGGTTGQVLSKNTNSDMDFTWVTTNDADAIQNSIVDAKGDLIAASANDTPARLAVGANNTKLVADSSTSTGLKYEGFVGCALYATNVSVSFTSGVAGKVPFALEEFDTDGFHDNVTNNTRITIPSGKAGKYLFNIMAEGQTIPSYFQLRFYKNNSLYGQGVQGGILVQNAGSLASYNQTCNASILLDCAVNDYFEFAIQSDWTTGSKNIYARFEAIYLGA